MPTEDPELKANALGRLTRLAKAARSQGGNPEDFIKVSMSDWMAKASATAISDVADAIEYWLTEQDHPILVGPCVRRLTVRSFPTPRIMSLLRGALVLQS